VTSRWCRTPLVVSAWLLLHGVAAVVGGLPSAWGRGVARSAPGHSCCPCAYPKATRRCCVFGLDLARAVGVVVSDLSENFAGPRSLPSTMTCSHTMHLLGGIIARLHILWILKFCQGAGPSLIPVRLQFCCGGGLLVWTWQWLLRCKRRQGPAPSSWIKLVLRLDVFYVVFCYWFWCMLCACCNSWYNS
jgi:hypothetical protein